MMDPEYSWHRTTANGLAPSSRARNSRDPLDRVVDLVVAPLDREGIRQMRGEGLNAEPLGRMVPRGEQVNAELLGGGVVRLLGLTGEERVEALVGSADQVVAGRAGCDGEAADPLGPVVEARAARDRARR